MTQCFTPVIIVIIRKSTLWRGPPDRGSFQGSNSRHRALNRSQEQGVPLPPTKYPLQGGERDVARSHERSSHLEKGKNLWTWMGSNYASLERGM